METNVGTSIDKYRQLSHTVVLRCPHLLLAIFNEHLILMGKIYLCQYLRIFNTLSKMQQSIPDSFMSLFQPSTAEQFQHAVFTVPI